MKRSELKRKTPLRSTPTRKRSPTKKPLRELVHCSYSPRCKKRPREIVSPTERYCPAHATDVADKIIGDIVKARDGYRCQLVGFNAEPCYIPQQVYWCHIIPKGRYRPVRWEPDNAVTGCAGHHKAFDESPIEKDEWAERRLGSERWHELRVLARQARSVAAVDVIREARGSGAPGP